MTSILFALTGALAAISVALGLWGAAKRRSHIDASIHTRRLKADLEKKTRDLAYFEERNKTLAADRARIESERDRYRAIATSRDLPPPDQLPSPVRILDPLWVDRIYANHPRVNLERLAADIDEYAGEAIFLTIRLDPKGGWISKLKGQPERTYTGSTDRVLEDLVCWLRDDDMRLVERRSEGVEWSDDDSPLHFHIDLARVTDERPEVHVQTVEIAVVETKVIERFVEQPVVIEVPTMPSSQVDVSVGLSRDEVMALFEVELESKLAELGLHRIHDELPPQQDRKPRAIVARQKT